MLGWHSRKFVILNMFFDIYGPLHSYSSGMRLSGIVYLMEISQTRIGRTSRHNLGMFKDLCILGTTKWDGVPSEVGQQREDQLRDVYDRLWIRHYPILG